ncbi:hypothetical protein J6590_020524 [Homalodisca vitripennis]|nr:hypothetical protein J6590_020524 [Homalodisca vitripennis]
MFSDTRFLNLRGCTVYIPSDECRLVAQDEDEVAHESHWVAASSRPTHFSLRELYCHSPPFCMLHHYTLELQHISPTASHYSV